jgi:hypothetical protein
MHCTLRAMTNDKASPEPFLHYLPDAMLDEVELWIENASDVAMLRAISGKDPVELIQHQLRHLAGCLSACADQLDERDAQAEVSHGR